MDRPSKPACEIPAGFYEQAATRLVTAGLVALFIDAQFNGFPDEWCMLRFRRPYPPPSIIFGAGCWDRYEKLIREPGSYLKRG